MRVKFGAILTTRYEDTRFQFYPGKSRIKSKFFFGENGVLIRDFSRVPTWFQVFFLVHPRHFSPYKKVSRNFQKVSRIFSKKKSSGLSVGENSVYPTITRDNFRKKNGQNTSEKSYPRGFLGTFAREKKFENGIFWKVPGQTFSPEQKSRGSLGLWLDRKIFLPKIFGKLSRVIPGIQKSP